MEDKRWERHVSGVDPKGRYCGPDHPERSEALIKLCTTMISTKESLYIFSGIRTFPNKYESCKIRIQTCHGSMIEAP